MEKQIKKAYEFDFVFDSLTVFRQLLQALSNPGTNRDIKKEAELFEGCNQSLMALGCTLLDYEQKMYVEKNPRLSEALHNLTLCREGTLEEADYVFLSSEMNYGSMEQVLKNVKRGTYADPQQSATVLQQCVSVEGTSKLVLSGPGIDGTKSVSVCEYVKKVIEIREKLDMEYPLGVDLIFVDEKGSLLGIPRLVKIEK